MTDRLSQESLDRRIYRIEKALSNFDVMQIGLGTFGTKSQLKLTTIVATTLVFKHFAHHSLILRTGNFQNKALIAWDGLPYTLEDSGLVHSGPA